MLRRLLPVLFLLSFPGALAAAPPSTPAPKPDEATVAEAVRLLDADGFDESIMRSTELTVGMSTAGMTAQLQKQFGDALPSDLMDQVRSTMHDHAMTTMRSHLAEVKRQVAEIYAQEFTRAELIHLRELHSDPVAVKARARDKAMEPKLMLIGVRTMQAAEPELDARIKRLVEEYFAAHGKSSTGSSS